MTLCSFVCMTLPSLPCPIARQCCCVRQHTLCRRTVRSSLNSASAVQAWRGIPMQGRLGSRTQHQSWQPVAQT